MRTKESQALFLPAPKLNQLHILTELASDPGMTQAELAQRCALSVAMVNNYMKQLCSGGLVEYRRRSSKSISYHLTASGKAEAAATQGHLLLEMVSFFFRAKARVREIVLGNGASGLRRVMLYGSGDLAELAFHALESAGLEIIGVCDDDPAAIGRDWCGREVLNPSQIRLMVPDAVIVADSRGADQIQTSLACLSERGIRLILLSKVSATPDAGSTSSPESRQAPLPQANDAY